jgi:hypothetical protein
VDLQGLNVGGLQALRAADNLKFDRLAVVQAAVPIRLNRGEMDENVLSGLALDKAKAFAGIEPLHCSLFFVHFSFLFSKKLSDASTAEPDRARLRLSLERVSGPLSGHKKRPQVVEQPCDRFTTPKTIQEQQTQTQCRTNPCICPARFDGVKRPAGESARMPGAASYCLLMSVDWLATQVHARFLLIHVSVKRPRRK